MKLKLTQHFSVFLPRDKEREKGKGKKKEYRVGENFCLYIQYRGRARERGQGGMRHVDFLSIN